MVRTRTIVWLRAMSAAGYGAVMGQPNVVVKRSRRRTLITGVPAVTVAVVASIAILAAGTPVGSAAPASQWAASVLDDAAPSGLVSGTLILDTVPETPSATVATATVATAIPTRSAGPTFKPLAVVTSAPGPKGRGPDPSRPIPAQSGDWLALKAAGLVAIVDGKVTILPADANPLVIPSTGLPVPATKMLDVSWTRWVVETLGVGHDDKGSYYHDLSYWKLCGDGAMTVALWYWQQLTGYPNVTGTAGYFLDPYAAQGASWPKPGPTVPRKGGKKLGTYWAGVDTQNGYMAVGRGFEMYLATAAKPAGWTSAGLAVFAAAGKPLYPSTGTDRSTIQVGLNWEVSGHDASTWATAYYASVVRSAPFLAHDLNSAVMLDLGRDGVPVIAAVDSFYLPNWANGNATQHAGHSIAIVGYDNTANPPTYSYIDTCGHACNPRTANREGRVYVIPQSRLSLAMKYTSGAGFVW